MATKVAQVLTIVVLLAVVVGGFQLAPGLFALSGRLVAVATGCSLVGLVLTILPLLKSAK